jgi:hypothetical protein
LLVAIFSRAPAAEEVVELSVCRRIIRVIPRTAKGSVASWSILATLVRVSRTRINIRTGAGVTLLLERVLLFFSCALLAEHLFFALYYVM